MSNTHRSGNPAQTQAVAIVIPVSGPVEEVLLDGTLEHLQRLVGGWIEALPVPEAVVRDAHRCTCYVNEDGKFAVPVEPNMRATDFLVPGVGLFFGDYIAGPLVIVGFDSLSGEHIDVPDSVRRRVRLIESEAGV
jgi:Domain of unknown function (DUF3846)